MKFTPLAGLAALTLAALAPTSALAESAAKEASEKTAAVPANPALDAKPQKPRKDYDWMARHEAILALNKTRQPEVVMIGDSITHMWGGIPDTGKYGNRGRVSWKNLFGDKPVLNIGFGADRVQNVLWRLRNGEMDGIKPKWVVLNIGTNNLVGGGNYDRACSPKEIAEGVENLLRVIRTKAPEAQLIVMGVFPRGATAKDGHRPKIVELNALVKRHCEGLARTTFLDIGEKFLQPDGTLPRELMPDHLHPSEKGYAIWADALAERLGPAASGQHPAATEAGNPALVAKPQPPRRDYDWMGRHEAILAGKDKLNPEVVMIGDSITHLWGGFPDSGKYGNRGPASWKKLFGDKPVLNLGFGADRTQNVLWRLEQGEMDGLKPKWVVINIGTNNLGGGPGDYGRACTPPEIAEATWKIVSVVREKAPSAKIIVMGVFPRGASPEKNSHRVRIKEINTDLAKRCEGEAAITFLDIGDKFLEPDGTLSREILRDLLHPTEKGYAIWGEELARVMTK